MPAYLVRSSHLDALAVAWADRVAEERRRLPPAAALFSAVRVVVPNRATGDVLRRTLARRLGVAAHIQTPFLPAFLAELGATADPPLRPLDRRIWQGWLLTVLHDEEALQDPALAPVRAYLLAAGTAPDAVDRRRVQLSERLARRFDEHAFLATDGLAAAPAGPAWFIPLWRRLVTAERMGGEEKGRLASAAEILNQATGKPPAPLHLFVPAPWGRAWPEVFARLSTNADLHLYLLGPSPEPLPLPVRLTAPGTRFERLLREAAPRAERQSLDEAGQELVSAGHPALAHTTLLVAPQLRREVEAIAVEIVRLMAATSAAGDGPLRFDEIAVLLPGAASEAYLTHIGSVFREAGNLPHVFHDAQLARQSRVMEAVDRLLALPVSRFTRAEVMPLLLHPLVMARCPEDDPADWLRLADHLGIAQGLDGSDRPGTYLTDDSHTWAQGLRRLTLGAFMEADELWHGVDEEPGGGDVPAHLADADRPGAIRFLWLARTILAEARLLRDSRMTLPAWIDRLSHLLTSTIIAVAPEDERALQSCLRELRALRDMPVAGPLSYRLVADLIRNALGTLTANRSSHPTLGITVASLLSARGQPFRAIFIAGLSSGIFPAGDFQDEFDDPQGNDVTVSRSDQDRHLFLEALLAASDHLVFSYVARDERTGDPREASPVLTELLQHLTETERPPTVRRVPLFRHDDEGARQLFPAAAAESQAQQLGQDREGSGEDWRQDVAALPLSLRLPLQERLGWLPPPERGAETAPAEISAPNERTISLQRLRRFLECPLQASASSRLGLRDEDDSSDALYAEDEPFETAPRRRRRWLTEIFVTAVQMHEGQPAAALSDDWLAGHYDRHASLARAQGHGPAGPFAQAERTRHLRVVRGWADALLRLTEGHPLHSTLIYLGGAGEQDLAGFSRPALRLPAAALVGCLSLLVAAPDGGWISLVLDPRADPEHHLRSNGREALRGVLDQLVLAAVDVGSATTGRHRVAVAHPRSSDAHKARAHDLFLLSLAPVTGAEARERLDRWTRDLLGDSNHYLMPWEAVFDAWKSHRPLAAVVEEIREADRPHCSSLYGPVPCPLDYPPPDAELAQSLIRQRFEHLLGAFDELKA